MPKELLYMKTARVMEEKILSSEWLPGYQLPTEMILCKELGVSHATLREAIRTLVDMDLLTVNNGVGTFVQHRSEMLLNTLTSLNSVGDMIRLSGAQPGAVCRQVEHVRPDEKIRRKLQLNEQELIVKVHRVRTADGKPIAVAVNIFPEKVCGNIFDDGIPGKIFDSLQLNFGIEIDYSMSKIKAVSGEEEEAQFAQSVLGPQIILMEQLHYSRKGKPVFFSYDYLNTDFISLEVKRRIRR